MEQMAEKLEEELDAQDNSYDAEDEQAYLQK